MYAQMVLTFREAFEALLLLVIILAYLKRTGRAEEAKFAYFGAVLAVFLGIAASLAIFGLYGGLEEKELFEAAASYLAVIVLTSVILWMAGKDVKEDVERKMSEKLKWGVAIVAFVFVVREVVETVLFLTPYFVRNLEETILGVVVGVAFAALLSYGVLKMEYKISMRKFFYYTSVLLIFIASGLLGYGTHELVEYLEEKGYESWLFEKAYDLGIDENSVFHHKNMVGSVLAVFGYSTSMEWVRVILQTAYLLSFLTAVSFKYRAAIPSVKVRQ